MTFLNTIWECNGQLLCSLLLSFIVLLLTIMKLKEKIIPEFKQLHGPNYQALIMVDNSQGHGIYASNALLTWARLKMHCKNPNCDPDATDCCAKQILDLQPDFQEQKSLIHEIIEAARHLSHRLGQSFTVGKTLV